MVLGACVVIHLLFFCCFVISGSLGSQAVQILQALPSPKLNKVATESIEVVDLNLKSVRNFKLIDGLEDCSHVLLVLSESLFKL